MSTTIAPNCHTKANAPRLCQFLDGGACPLALSHGACTMPITFAELSAQQRRVERHSALPHPSRLRRRQVSAMEPAGGVEGLGRALRVVIIAAHDVMAAIANFPRLPARQQAARGRVYDLLLLMWHDFAHGVARPEPRAPRPRRNSTTRSSRGTHHSSCAHPLPRSGMYLERRVLLPLLPPREERAGQRRAVLFPGAPVCQ